MLGKSQRSKGQGRVTRLSRWLRPRRTTPVTSNSQESSEDETGFGVSSMVTGKRGVSEKENGVIKVMPAEGTSLQQQEERECRADVTTRGGSSQAGPSVVSEIEEVGSGDRDVGANSDATDDPPPFLFSRGPHAAGVSQQQTQGPVSSNQILAERIVPLRTAASDVSSLRRNIAYGELQEQAALTPQGTSEYAACLVLTLFCTALLCLPFGGPVAVFATALVSVLATPFLSSSRFQTNPPKNRRLSITIPDPSSKSPEILPTPPERNLPQRAPASAPIPTFRPRGATPSAQALGRRTPRTSQSAFLATPRSRDPPDLDLGESAAVKNHASFGSAALFRTASDPIAGRSTPGSTTPSPTVMSTRSRNPPSNRSATERDFVDLTPGDVPKWPAAAAFGDDSGRGNLSWDLAAPLAVILVIALAALMWSPIGAVLGSAVVFLLLGVHSNKEERKAQFAIPPPPVRAQSAPVAELARIARSEQNMPRLSTLSPARTLSTLEHGRTDTEMKRRHSVPSRLVG